ncbi:MAG: TetR/AcrR family transcriptional regulator, partial [Firmicutes bacterium]|nr:TetR/AcrR family transcriptional regulator [Bacillota bacterium]
MPKKPTTPKEAMIEGAIELIREKGHEDLTVRKLAAFLGCSTQPIMYHFATIDSLKRTVYARADQEHSEYLMRVPPGQDPVLAIGLNYVRYAVEEPRLFRFLFQSGYTEENTLLEMIDCEELEPVLAAMQEGTGMDRERTRQVFLTVALFAHGYASIIANNALEYDEALIAE